MTDYFKRVVKSLYGEDKYHELMIHAEILEAQETRATCDDPEYCESLDARIDALLAELNGET